MDDDHSTPRANSATDRPRRRFLETAAVTVSALAASGTAAAVPGRGKGGGGGAGSGGFPPSGITAYGDEVDLGAGSVRTFTTETPSGVPKYHGVEFDRSALDGLPDADELAGAPDEYPDKYGPTGEALTVHRKASLEFFVPFPDASNTPFTFLGLNWNPEGHPGGAGAWLTPHFDIHFHTLEPATIDAIEGPALPPYDEVVERDEKGRPTAIETALDRSQIPSGYQRSPPVAAGERYITDMGEHAAPADAPELPDGPGEPGDPSAFSNTLIQGFVDVGDGDDPRLAFVEPMITREFFRNHSGTERYDVPQPETYPYDGPQYHPTGYSVRDVPSRDAIVVAVQDFDAV
ncbi:hypothetical protein DJ69_05220 [Halorubrum persicum]|uniref:DUF5602 domain-containing protein n=1 Tax=Halorubrum persicum TaxID=1383844 RepID=A0A2G1WKW9_9EURY|nr:hypothetical protein [Halorubrum persicum]PHQ39641.1 hypothetical protein DJ69_05220 [Halorubrum persicum]